MNWKVTYRSSMRRGECRKVRVLTSKTKAGSRPPCLGRDPMRELLRSQNQQPVTSRCVKILSAKRRNGGNWGCSAHEDLAQRNHNLGASQPSSFEAWPTRKNLFPCPRGGIALSKLTRRSAATWECGGSMPLWFPSPRLPAPRRTEPLCTLTTERKSANTVFSTI